MDTKGYGSHTDIYIYVHIFSRGSEGLKSLKMFCCFQIVIFFLGVLSCVAKKPVPPSCNQEPLEAETVASPTSDTVRDGELAQLESLLAKHREIHLPTSVPTSPTECTKTPLHQDSLGTYVLSRSDFEQ